MVKITKKTRTSSLCPHEHFVNLIIGLDTCTQSEVADVLNEGASTSTELDDENIWLQNSSLYRYRHQRISLKDEDMKPIEKQIVEAYKKDTFQWLYQVYWMYYQKQTTDLYAKLSMKSKMGLKRWLDAAD